MTRLFTSMFWRAVGYGILLELMLAAAVLFWPNFRDNIGALKLMAPLPVLKEMVDVLAQGGVAAYINGQHFFKGVNTMGAAAAVLFACGAVAGEVHRGTFEIWLARPLSRRRLLAERWLFGALAVCVPVFATSATIPWLCTFVDERMDLGLLMLASVHQSLFLLGIYGATFLWSTCGKDPTKIAFAMLFLVTFEFGLYMVKTVTHYSIFRLTDVEAYVDLWTRRALDPVETALLALVALALLGASLVAIERRVP